jgi:hypothetical protein
LVELKANRTIEKIHEDQLINYLNDLKEKNQVLFGRTKSFRFYSIKNQCQGHGSPLDT